MIKRFINYSYYIFEFYFTYFPFFTRLFIKFHEFSVLKEIELLQVSSSEKVLHIGCGAIPYTSIIIARKTKAEVVALDNKQNIVNAATSFIKRYNLSDRIKIEFGDGKDFNVLGYDIVIISYGISNQDLVLENVIKSIKNKTRIILRRQITNRENYFDTIIEDLSFKSKKVLLTQESILIVKGKHQ